MEIDILYFCSVVCSLSFSHPYSSISFTVWSVSASLRFFRLNIIVYFFFIGSYLTCCTISFLLYPTCVIVLLLPWLLTICYWAFLIFFCLWSGHYTFRERIVPNISRLFLIFLLLPQTFLQHIDFSCFLFCFWKRKVCISQFFFRLL